MTAGSPKPDGDGPAEFVAALRALRVWSGATYRELAAKTRASGEFLPASTIASALGRSSLPRVRLVRAITRACGLDEDAVAEWVAVRNAVAARAAAAEPAEPVGPDDPVPAMLPADAPDFTGRAAPVERIRRLLTEVATEDSAGTAVAIVDVAGMGGVGKTALAVHVAHREAASFPDGQLYADLRGAEAAALDPGDVLAQFLRALGVDSRRIPADLAERSAMFRTRLAGRRIMVVLDNAASEQQVRPLLPGAGTCAVIVTSRTRLTGIEGVHLVDLDVLAPDEALRLLAGVVGRERVDAEPAAAAEIVELCGNLPLAVRIASARLAARPAWWLAHLAARLRDERSRLDQLKTGDLAVRASLALSCEGLSGEPRRLFQLLGLFDVPDFPGWLGAVVLGGSLVQAQEHLEALVDARLLTVAGVDAAGQVRYGFHDLVRLVAREQAELEQSAEGRVEALARGLGGWLAVAERMAAGVPGPCYAAISGPAARAPIVDEQVLRLDPEGWFDAERATLLCLIRQAVRLDLTDVAFDLAGCLEKYFDLRGMYAEWVCTNEEVMAACRAAGNRLGEAVMLRGLIDVRAWLTEASGQGAMTRFHTDAFRLLDLFDELGHTRGTADAAVMCSWASTGVGAYGEAIDLATRALRLAERSDHTGGVVRAHHALALAHFEQADLSRAAEHAANALEAARALGNPRTEATALQFFGIALRELGELEASERMLVESLAISRRYRDNYTQALTMLALARLHVKRGDPRARAEVEAALAVSREYGMSHHLADALHILGEIELAEHRPEAAVAHLEESVSIWRARGWRSFHAEALTSLGRAYLQLDREAAERALGEAQRLYAALGNSAKVAELECLLAVMTPLCP